MIAQARSPVSKVAQSRFGKRPSPTTIWRWVHRGVRGVKLQAVSFGGQWQCSESEFDAFVQAQTAAVLSDDAPAERDEVTAKKLRAAGVL